jgi:hypothetical protein
MGVASRRLESLLFPIFRLEAEELPHYQPGGKSADGAPIGADLVDGIRGMTRGKKIASEIESQAPPIVLVKMQIAKSTTGRPFRNQNHSKASCRYDFMKWRSLETLSDQRFGKEDVS